jgi:ABC-2 type transport system ATP-binding protein
LLRIENLTKYYKKQEKPALENVSLTIPEGTVFGLLGPNGAGKTTLISILVGLQKKTDGGIWFNGQPLEQSLAEVRSVTGFVPQDLAFYPMLSVAENLSFYAEAFGVNKGQRKQHIDYALDATRLHEHVTKRADNLSGGLKRRLNLAIGLLNKPKLLILDEPTVGIDPQSRAFILETIGELNRQSGITIIYTSHYMQEVQQLCDTIAILDDGKIQLHGELQQLLSDMSRSHLEFRLQNHAAPELVNMLQESFAAKSSDGYNFTIEQVDVPAVLSELPALLQQQGNSMAGIRYGYQGLEDLYMAQTRHDLGGLD